MNREDTWTTTVKVRTAGGRDWTDLGTWDKFDGGEVSADSVKYRPGGLRDQVSLGSVRTVSNASVQRLYDELMDAKVRMLHDGVGKLDMLIIRQPLDADGNVHGNPISYTGKLNGVRMPNSDNESSNAAYITLEQDTESKVVI